MFWILKAILFGEFVVGGAFGLVLFVGWVSGKIEVHITKEKKDRP